VQAYTRVVGRGGLDEEADGDEAGSSAAAASAASAAGGVIIGPSAGAGARRANANVSEAQVVRHPSEAERVLQLLQQQIGKLGMARWVGQRRTSSVFCETAGSWVALVWRMLLMHLLSTSRCGNPNRTVADVPVLAWWLVSSTRAAGYHLCRVVQAPMDPMVLPVWLFTD
jgi:hypothetical protein